MNNKQSTSEISHLLFREIQAPLAASLIKGFAKQFDQSEAYETAKNIICEDAKQAGKALALKYSDNSLKTMLKIATQVWAKDGTMEIENIELDDKSLNFDVTHCGYAKLYETLGIKDMGTLLSCSRDFAFLKGFNPDIELERTKTIMEGDAVCNFCYKMK